MPLLLRYHPFRHHTGRTVRTALCLVSWPIPIALARRRRALLRPFGASIAACHGDPARLIQIANEKRQINEAAEKLQELNALAAINVRDALGRQVYSTVDLIFTQLFLLRACNPVVAPSRYHPTCGGPRSLGHHSHAVARAGPAQNVTRPSNAEHQAPASSSPNLRKMGFLIADGLEMRVLKARGTVEQTPTCYEVAAIVGAQRRA